MFSLWPDILPFSQDGTDEIEYIYAVAISDDGSIFMGGMVDQDFTVIKLSADGEKEWQWVVSSPSTVLWLMES